MTRLTALFLIVFALSACSSLDRDDAAAKARTRMLGMTREEILSCMGPPKKKAHENTTEVWSYASTDYSSQSSGDAFYAGGYGHTEGSHSKSFCTVNIVMKDGVVTGLHYLGPTATHFYNKYDQCGYAVQACVQ